MVVPRKQIPWSLLVNIVGFQLGWFACLLLSGYWPVIVAVTILTVHFTWVVPKTLRRSEGLLLLVVLLVGTLLEVCYLYFEVLVNRNGAAYPALWLLCIWLLFATTLRYSLAWLYSKPILSIFFAGIAAPASYYAGVGFNSDVGFGLTVPLSLFVIGLSWCVVFPLLLRVAHNINRTLSTFNV